MSRMKSAIAVLCLSMCVAATGRASNDVLRIAAAASLRPVLEAAVTVFQNTASGATVTVSYGASGSLCAQIANGAPFDLFLSADTNYPSAVVAADNALAADEFIYASGCLALWTPSNATLNVAGDGLAALTNAAVRKVAMANPAHAPYGRAAEALLKARGLYENVSSKLVLGENVSQAAQFAQSGAAEVALIPLSLALTPEMKKAGTFVVLDAADCPRIVHGAVILKNSSRAELARRFKAWLLSEAGVELLKAHGFSAAADAD